ncbi:MAG: hypothetical protein GX968_02015 [Tissierellia bacterium]|nr:hypothetical protein [Tissierellia bacterium]
MITTITLNVFLDLNIYVDKLRKNQNNRTKNMKYDIGGKATHVSLVLSALGIENIATGIMGGYNRKTIVEMMETRDINCEFIFQEGEDTRITYIIVQEEEGGTFMLTEPGFTINDKSLDLFKEKIIEIVALTLGEKGSIISTLDRSLRIIPPDIV